MINKFIIIQDNKVAYDQMFVDDIIVTDRYDSRVAMTFESEEKAKEYMDKYQIKGRALEI